MLFKTRTRISFWVPFALAATGCNLGPGDCDFFRIESRMVGSVERSGHTTPAELVQDAYAFQSHLFPNHQHDFEVARAFLVEGRVGVAGSLGWSVSNSSGSGSPTLHLGFLLQAPRHTGEVVQVGTGPFLGYWRPYGATSLASAEVAVGLENFTASLESGGTVSGTMTIVGTQPLHFTIDVLATDADAEEVRVQGDLTFQAFGNSIGCD